jgi:plastocyanin
VDRSVYHVSAMFEPEIHYRPKFPHWRTRLALAGAAIVLFAIGPGLTAGAQTVKPQRYYLPGAQASKIVTVTRTGNAANEVTVLTQAVAVKETGPQETIKRFGEVYEFSPAVIAVHRDEPTMITFWNLQPDDTHDFALLDHDFQVMMYENLPPLRKTSYIFTFHKEGLFDFKCLQHQPEMAGQIIVLPLLAKH